MRKRIVALIGALTLTFAMSLNAFAQPSPDTQDAIDRVNQEAASTGVTVEAVEGETAVRATAGSLEVRVSTDPEELRQQAAAMSGAQVQEEGMTRADIRQVTPAEAAVAARDAARYLAAPRMEGVARVTGVVAVSIPVNIPDPRPAGETGRVRIGLTLAAANVPAPGAGEQLWAIDCDKNVAFPCIVREDGTFYFESDSFSKYVFSTVKVETQSTNRPNNDGGNQAAAPNADTTTDITVPVVAVAPKTGDMAAMVGIMAIIFLGGAVTAAAMARKRA